MNTTGSKTNRGNKSSDMLTPEELEKYKQLLLDTKQKILTKAQQAVAGGDIHLDKNEMMDEVDLAAATVGQDLTFRMLDRDRKLLAKIMHALTKIANGTYGFCEGTGEPIPKRRLELCPWSQYSVKFKEHTEKMGSAGGDDEAEAG
ncbi:MAG: TraR/DksA family transcriptional regulator [Pseudomonadota bacterium]|nr:TraR/DksA family transcriptional regulator [Pseudomonadota bacterium]